MTSLILEQEELADAEPHGRSRGKRRTAREIAQMFEQLKQRHIARKKEWQCEKEELLKRAAMADESKRVLTDLKKILEELRIELRNEERKRTEAQADHDKMKALWEQERSELLKTIQELRSHGSNELKHEKITADKITELTNQLASRERNLAEVEKLNAELRMRYNEQRRHFEEEKRIAFECHEGERRNWDKAKQVMLDKIEALQEECSQLRSNAFPLHGSHVASPTTDDQISATSPVTDDRSSTNDERQTSVCAEEKHNVNANALAGDGAATKYNHFQKTVDEALKQIEKISQDLNSLDVDVGSEKEARTSLTPIRLSSSESSYRKSPSSFSHGTNSNEKKESGRLGKISTDKSSASSLPGSNPDKYSTATSFGNRETTKLNSEKNPKTSCSIVAQTSLQDSGYSKSTKQSDFDTTQASLNFPERRSSRDQPTISSLASNSPVGSSTTSCSVINYTESGTDSASLVPSAKLRVEYGSSDAEKRTNALHKNQASSYSNKDYHEDKDKSIEFVKVEKRYISPRSSRSTEKNSKVSSQTKKLPNLHQKLLFRNPLGAEIKSHVNSSQQVKEQSQSRSAGKPLLPEDKNKIPQTLYSEPEKESQKIGTRFSYSSGPQDHSTGAITDVQRRLDAPKNLPENFIAHSGESPPDFISAPEKSAKLRPTTEATSVLTAEGPPVRPKPSVTIEKDASGNVLRVITDPRFQTQLSPNPSPNVLTHEASSSDRSTSTKQRSGEVTRESSRFLPVFAREDERSFDAPTNGKPGIGKLGKDWIRKKLPFLDSSPTAVGEKEERHRSKSSSSNQEIKPVKTRSTSARRSEKCRRNLERSMSEESLDETNRTLGIVRTKRNPKKATAEPKEKDAKSSKSRLKRYTRSKTDSPLEMKNLFSRFRQAQFTQKKPSIVKQFERKLLENEVKTLQQQSTEARDDKKPEHQENLKTVGDAEDDGYKGEDELDAEASPERKDKKVTESKDKTASTLTTTTSMTLTPSIVTFQPATTQKNPPKVLPKSSHYTSMIDLRWPTDQMQEEPSESPEMKQGAKDFRLPKTSKQTRAEYKNGVSSSDTIDPATASRQAAGSTDTAASEESQSVSALVGRFDKTNVVSPPAESFVRGGHGRYSLNPETVSRYRRNTESSILRKSLADPLRKPIESKRLSWAATPREIEQKEVSWRDRVIAPATSPSADLEKPEEQSTSTKTPRRKMSEEMLKKKFNLEQVFSREPKRSSARRYRRSETQPIAKINGDSDSENDSPSAEDFFWTKQKNNSGGMMKKAISMQDLGEANTEACDGADKIPSLTSRFKKPSTNNRRPTRWRKKD